MVSYLDQILGFPKQLYLEGLQLSNAAGPRGRQGPDDLVLIGIGGSVLPANLISGLRKYANLKPPIIVWKSYGLPEHDFKNPLYIFVFFSGNTEETLSGLKQLLKKLPRGAEKNLKFG